MSFVPIKYELNNSSVMRDKLGKLSIFVWMLILVSVGTYFRIRPVIDTRSADWLILVQLLLCTVGGILGISLLRKHKPIGFGGKALIIHIFIVACSALFSLYFFYVLGYWILISGVGLLTIGLVQWAETQKELNQIENAWLLTITLLLLKDTITAIVFPEMQTALSYGGIYRIGMGVTHANLLSFLAVLAFWVSFKNETVKYKIWLWAPRLLFLFVIVLSRCRVAMVAFFFAGGIRFWFKYSLQHKKSLYFRIAITCLFIAVLILGILGSSLKIPLATSSMDFLKREQNIDEIMTFTGRSKTWRSAINEVFDEPISFIFGHGYGVTRSVLSKGILPVDSSHAHSTFLEILLSVGLIGTVTFVVLFIYSLHWLKGFHKLRQRFSPEFTLRAISVISIVILSFITESFLVTKINPIMIIYYFYVLSLDKRKCLI